MFSLILHAWRSWKSAKAVALLAVAAIAVGIGSATAIYTVVDAVLLQPLAYRHGERFAALFSADVNEPGRYSSTSVPDLQDYQRRTHSFDLFGIFQPGEFILTSPGAPQHLRGVQVSPELVAGLGVNPIVGRWFGATAGEQGNVGLAVISEGLWKRLGGGADIVGRTIVMDARSYTVTGVMPAWFRFPVTYIEGGEFRADVWVPLHPMGPDRRRDVSSFFSYVRLKPGVTFAEATADVRRVAAELVKENSKMNKSYTAVLANLKELVIKEIRPTLLLLVAAAGALLLITCANVAGLLLSRSVARSRETAIRAALGASTRQLAIQYFVEGLLVALAGSVAGVGVALLLVRFLLTMAIDSIPRADSIGVNWSALVFAFGAALLSSVLFSLAPLWQAARIQPNEALGDGVRTSAGTHSRWLSRSLVVAEIAMSFALLSVSALLLTNLGDILRTPSGLNPEHLLTFSLSYNRLESLDDKRRNPYQRRLLDAIGQIPGVTSVAFANQIPVEGCCFVTGLFPEGAAADPNDPHVVSYMVVSPDYFRTMQIPLHKGRMLDENHATEGDTLDALVDRAAARRYFPGREAVGAFGRLGAGGSRVRVVGVVGDVRNNGLTNDPMPELFLSNSVAPVDPMRFLVRTPLPLSVVLPEIRRAIQRVNPAQPIYGEQTMRDVFLGSVVRERLQSFLTAFFASAALLMAILGVYGVVAYAVRQRTVEMGTRMALGAVSRDVFRLVLGDGLRMALWGTVIGGIVVAATALLLRSQVFGLRIGTPLPFLYSTAIVAGFSTLACLFPAWRAALVTPMAAIRDDPGSIWHSVSSHVSGMLKESPAAATALEGSIMTDFVDASRHADTFRQALNAALGNLATAVHASSAQVLAREGSGPYLCVAVTPPENKVSGVPAEGILAGRLRCFPFPLPLAAEELETWARWAAQESPQYLAEIESLREGGAALAVPLLAKREIAGVLLLGAPQGRTRYSGGEKNALRNCAALFTLMLENARLTDRMVEQEKLRRDVQLAVEVQKRLFPDKPPVSGVITLAGVSIPARSVGGDYYDFLSLGDGKIGIALADVAGKGIAAALVMSVVQASLRILVTDPAISLAELATRMNRYLHRSTGTSSYATFFYAQIDEDARQLRYVNAGHNPPYLMRRVAGGTIEELPAGGAVIGLFPQMAYEEAVLDLNPGDVLVAFTDGVPEALNPADEEFGEDRIRALLNECAGLSVDALAERIAGDLKTWIGDAAQYDDLTFILMKVS